MANPFTLPTLAVLTLVGTGTGLLLGNSALSEINPSYFSSPASASRFHADLVPGGGEWDDQAPPLQNAAFESGLGSGCINCRTYPEEYLPVPDSGFEAYVASYTSTAAPESYAELAAVETGATEADPGRRDVERYAGFAVSADEQPVAITAAATPATDCAVAEQCAGASTPGI